MTESTAPLKTGAERWRCGFGRADCTAAGDIALEREEPLLGQREALADLRSAEAPVFRIHVAGDLLQRLDQQGFEPHQRLQLPADRIDQRRHRPGRLAVTGGIPIQVIDERRIEALLRFERRAQHAPDETPQPSLDRAVERRRTVRQDVPGGVDVRKARGVVLRRRRRENRDGLQRTIDGSQRVVVQAVGGRAFAFETRQQIFDGLVVGHRRL